ncbi:hypothetical protein [Echinicola vietnamensis]|uniref:Uncharacterized protein n=1 Tax=Echinicola vietnamensis (strain DSM 17526 / LMG 23754 / KMM 6221) TaxID=926556 RepID=L0G0U4_ECHVK|nr:hypothetical protein [Echinicola vietnamensis]AGA78616.1 hypothetical protein Echvi_2368 [Echinicola vietnamensis DSM 17526]
MKMLSDNWISEGWIDFEYKKYLLLAYLKEVEQHFGDVKLYPPLADLIRHYHKLRELETNKDGLRSAFPKRVVGIDHKNVKLRKEQVTGEGELMKALDEIIAFSIPQISKQIEQGKSIYDFIEDNLEVEPVGLSPLYQREGYVFITLEKSADVFIYSYQMKLFENSFEKYRGIAFSFLRKETKSLVHTYEQIKLDLARSNQQLPNPATWRVHSSNVVPLEESLLPVSKRILLRMIA